MKPEEDLENQSEITKLLMAVSQVKQMSKLHEAPEEIFLQVDPEGDGPGEWDTLDGATWCQERINHNDVRYVRADRVMQLEAENSTLREALEDTDMNRKHAEGSTTIIDSEELVKRMKTFGLKGVRDGSVHFFIKPELLAEFLEAEIRAEREACAKIARQLEAENKRLREALNAIAEGEIYPVQVALAALAATEPKP